MLNHPALIAPVSRPFDVRLPPCRRCDQVPVRSCICGVCEDCNPDLFAVVKDMEDAIDVMTERFRLVTGLGVMANWPQFLEFVNDQPDREFYKTTIRLSAEAQRAAGALVSR